MKRLLFFKGVFFLISLLFLVAYACSEDDTPDNGSELVSFTGLEAGKDSLAIGESTMIKAIYEGKDVKFEWEASSGKLQGGGDEIEYIVAFCDIGINTITCKAIADNNTISRSINITVYVQ